MKCLENLNAKLASNSEQSGKLTSEVFENWIQRNLIKVDVHLKQKIESWIREVPLQLHKNYINSGESLPGKFRKLIEN